MFEARLGSGLVDKMVDRSGFKNSRKYKKLSAAWQNE